MAELAGLRSGDVIESVDGVDVRGMRSYLHDGLSDVVAGQVVILELVDGRRLELTAKPQHEE